MEETAKDTASYKHLRWRCRRGLKELDVMLERFLAGKFLELSEQDKSHFDKLLSESDMDLLEWVLGKSEPPSLEYKTLIADIVSSSG